MNINSTDFRFLVASLVCISTFACKDGKVDGNGRVIEQTRNVSRFKHIIAQNTFTILLVKSDSSFITLRTDENLVPLVHISSDGDSLHIQGDEKIGKPSELVVTVRFSVIETVNLIGALTLTSQKPIVTDKLLLNTTGAAKVEMELVTDSLITEGTGSAKMLFKGSSNFAQIEVDGAGSISAQDFTVDNLNLMLNGACTAVVNARSTLILNLSGACSVLYKGNPKISQNVTGASVITKQEK